MVSTYPSDKVSRKLYLIQFWSQEQALNIYRNPVIYADATEKLHVASFPEQIRVICDILNVRDDH